MIKYEQGKYPPSGDEMRAYAAAAARGAAFIQGVGKSDVYAFKEEEWIAFVWAIVDGYVESMGGLDPNI